MGFIEIRYELFFSFLFLVWMENEWTIHTSSLLSYNRFINKYQRNLFFSSISSDATYLCQQMEIWLLLFPFPPLSDIVCCWKCMRNKTAQSFSLNKKSMYFLIPCLFTHLLFVFMHSAARHQWICYDVKWICEIQKGRSPLGIIIINSFKHIILCRHFFYCFTFCISINETSTRYECVCCVCQNWILNETTACPGCLHRHCFLRFTYNWQQWKCRAWKSEREQTW